MDVIRQSLAITFVFLLLWAALWFLRKRRGISFSKGRSNKQILESRARLALTAQHSLHLIRIADRELVVAVHPAGVTVLSDLPRSAVPLTGPGES